MGIAHSGDDLVEVFLLKAEANELAPEAGWQGRQEEHAPKDQPRALDLDAGRDGPLHCSGHVGGHAGKKLMVLLCREVSIREYPRLIAQLVLHTNAQRGCDGPIDS